MRTERTAAPEQATFTEAIRDDLLRLHRSAVEKWAHAESQGRGWAEAYTADDAFRSALLAIEVSE